MDNFDEFENTVTWIGATIQVENPNYCILYDRHKSIDIFYTAFILQPYVHKSSSFPSLFYSMMKFKMHMIISRVEKRHYAHNFHGCIVRCIIAIEGA